MLEKDREELINKIVRSPVAKKIVIGGPGTGKTYLFEKIVKDKNKTLTLTFINDLVEDLSLGLYGISTVKTLHSYAQKELGRFTKNKIKIFPKLSEIIKEDAKVLLGKEIDFDKLFHNRDDNNPDIGFYKKRKNYYSYYGYSDVIFGIVKMFEKDKDKIPQYEQIIIDEFQDFNKLEVDLIELLAEKSSILLAGDDDQAIYEDLKNASPEHIRQRFSNKDYGYSPFILPYCSRCPRVIVEGVKDIIDTAKKKGFLKNRINKTFEYFENESKNRISDENLKIIYCQKFNSQIPHYIQEQLKSIAIAKRRKFSVLIISPLRKQAQTIAAELKKRGFKNVEFVEKKYTKKATLLDGLKILLEDKDNNLGWRIVSRNNLSDEDFNILIKKTDADTTIKIKDNVSGFCKAEVKKCLKILKAIKNGNKVDKEELEYLFKNIEINPFDLVKDLLIEDIDDSKKDKISPGLRKIPIKTTTIQSSKGLSSDYIFITHFDDRYFIKNKDKKIISDQEICNFIVSLARTKIRVFLISSIKERPTFLEWINKNRIE